MRTVHRGHRCGAVRVVGRARSSLPAPIDWRATLRGDVAHEPDSVFVTVHRAIVDEGWIVLQLHGFAEASHHVGAEAVVSSSEATPGPVVQAVADALARNGISARVYDGLSCQGLGGTRNTQGGHAREVGASFVHLELAAQGARTPPGAPTWSPR